MFQIFSTLLSAERRQRERAWKRSCTMGVRYLRTGASDTRPRLSRGADVAAAGSKGQGSDGKLKEGGYWCCLVTTGRLLRMSKRATAPPAVPAAMPSPSPSKAREVTPSYRRCGEEWEGVGKKAWSITT